MVVFSFPEMKGMSLEMYFSARTMEKTERGEEERERISPVSIKS